jgi:glycosyltransferase involved in cell wall biosynthesis
LGVDTELFSPDLSQRDAEVSIYTATAWPQMPVKGMHIVKKAIDGLDLKVNLITGQSRENVAKALKQAHIFLFPSCYEETFGLCLCEAMASGCACIASDVCGARAQIDHNITGLLVPPADPAALRDAIMFLLDNRSIRESIGYVAHVHVRKAHSLEAMGERWEGAYKQAMEEIQCKQSERLVSAVV